MPVHNWLTREEEQETIHAAWKRGRGVLFLTPHLGNWEHGGLLLAQMGIKLTVLTQPEPEDSLTDLRSASRARWGIETLIVGRDEFAFLEVIKRLQDGAALAITIDRPPERSAVLVNLFGRPFKVSLVAAELARASGCALVGVTVVRRPNPTSRIRACKTRNLLQINAPTLKVCTTPTHLADACAAVIFGGGCAGNCNFNFSSNNCWSGSGCV